MLWNSFGTIAALLQEIIAIYPAINPPALTAHQSNRVCNPWSSLLPQAPVLYFSTWLLYHVLSLMIRYILQVKNRQNERIWGPVSIQVALSRKYPLSMKKRKRCIPPNLQKWTPCAILWSNYGIPFPLPTALKRKRVARISVRRKIWVLRLPWFKLEIPICISFPSWMNWWIFGVIWMESDLDLGRFVKFWIDF